MKVLVLGAGQQGRIVAENLAARPGVAVRLADLAAPAGPLASGIEPVACDARDPASVRAAARGVDAAVTTLPSAIGTVALPILIDCGTPTVDVSFTPALPFHLDGAARRAGVPVLVDFGIAPGLSHVLAAALRRELGGLDSLRILVGGMPLAAPPVFRHAVYFNARDLVDEYLRPARVRVAGEDRALDPLAAPAERLADEEAGDLDAFPSDGLRSLLESFPDVPDMVELTLRVPGHLEAMRDLAALGLLDGDAADATARALDRRFPGAAHPDRLLLEVQAARGATRIARRVHVRGEGALTAMSRTTAYSAAAAAMLLVDKRFAQPGVHPPEALGADEEATRALLHDLAARGVRVAERSRLARR